MTNKDITPTDPLNDYERATLLPIMVKSLQTKRGKDKAVTNSAMRLGLMEHGYMKVSEARIRKIINHIRTNGLVECLVATSEGYFVSDDVQEVEKYIETLKSRENAIRAMREHVEEQCEDLRKRTSKN